MIDGSSPTEYFGVLFVLCGFMLLIWDILVKIFKYNFKDFFKITIATRHIGKDTGIASPKVIITFSIYSIMEDDKASSFEYFIS